MDREAKVRSMLKESNCRTKAEYEEAVKKIVDELTAQSICSKLDKIIKLRDSIMEKGGIPAKRLEEFESDFFNKD